MKVLGFIFRAFIVLGLFVGMTATYAAKTTDGEIIATMEAINNHEIAAAKLALSKHVSPQVEDFAKKMKEQHNANLNELSHLMQSHKLTADQTRNVEKFIETGEKKLQKLSTLNGQKFQSAYIDAMVNGHTDVKKQVAKFIKEAKNHNLKEYLQNTEKVVEQHLAAAKQLKHDNGKTNIKSAKVSY